jgi:arylsulfatase A-like enzyme/Flp pilus assembly protein TadD
MSNQAKKIKAWLGISLIGIILLIGGAAVYFLIFRPAKLATKRSEVQERPALNVLLITIDTLRADHLACYGYKRIETPHIDQLAKEGVLFKQNIADVPLTLPSHTSIMTGTYALYHNVIDNGNYRVPDKQTTIAEILKEYDYKTSAFVSAFVVDSRFGLDQGFDYYYDFDEQILDEEKAMALSEIQRIAEETTAVFYNWLREHRDDKFFTWLHLYDPHDPYTPPEPFASMYKNNLYDGEIAYVDKIIGEIISTFEAMGLLDKTIIIFVSDHGEGLGDHKEATHQFFIYDSVMHVPLIFRFPALLPAGKIIEKQTRNIDIVPTILSLLKIDIKKYPHIQGKDLTPLMIGQPDALPVDAFCQTEIPRLRFGWSDLHCIRDGEWKYIQAPKPELYHVVSDAGELHNVINQHEAKARELAFRLKKVEEKYSAKAEEEPASVELDAESLQKLQSLGYLSSSSSSAINAASKIDPKDKIEEFQLVNSSMSGAIKDIEQGRYQDAIAKLMKIKEVNPYFDTMHYYLGKAYLASGEPQKAIAEFKSTLKINDRHLLAHIDAAKAYVALGDFQAAEAILAKGFSGNLNSHLYHFNLGFIYQMKGDQQRALKEYLTAQELNPKNPQLYLNISSIYLLRKEQDKAAAYLEEALQLNPLQVEANTNLGLIFAEKGENEKAYDCFKKAVESNPRDFRPYYNLALICQKLGKREEARKAFDKARELGGSLPLQNVSPGQIADQRPGSKKGLYIIRHIISQDKSTADEIYYSLKNGMDFVQVAQRYASYSSVEISESYEARIDDLLEPLRVVVSHLNPGQYSPPIKTSHGYFILQRIS